MASTNSRPAFAFLLHPRHQRDVERFRLILAPELVAAAQHSFSPVVLKRLSVRLKRRTVDGVVIAVPLTPAQMKGFPREYVRETVLEAVDLATQERCWVIGLGALTSVVTASGQWVAEKRQVRLTTGNSYSAAVTVANIRTLFRDRLAQLEIAVVGATGSVGSCCAGLLVRHCRKLVLAGRSKAMLESRANDIAGRGAEVAVNTDLQDLRASDAVVLCTGAARVVLRAGAVRRDAVIFDLSEPSDYQSGEGGEDREVYQGGLVRIPGMELDLGIGLPPDTFFACFAETLLLALAGGDGRVFVGRATVENANYLEDLGERFGLEPRLVRRQKEIINI